MRETMDRERLIKIAVIGAGNIATRHLENLVFLGNVEKVFPITEDHP